ncbi:MAG: hypothetical protein JWL77_5597 [Chthonomonadaceae bacterium]|nr:hypothetical protein [Chthonomonadaceae bacterium]
MAPEELTNSSTSLAIRLFGPFDVTLDGQPLPRLRTRKGQWLLALLLLRYPQSVDRHWLAGVLWAESDESQAAYNLRRSLSDLHHVLGKEAYRLHALPRSSLHLDLSGAMVDLFAFDAAIAAGDLPSLERAITLYRGPLLEGCMEEWVLPEREAREQSYLLALERLAEEQMARHESQKAVVLLRHVLAVDPLREATRMALMEALVAGGDYAAAILVYRELRLLLHRELNIEPAPATTARFRDFQAAARRRALPRSSALPLRTGSAERPPSHIPHPITDVIGREQEVYEVEVCLASARLMTLTGVGGVGKTRLAIQIASESADCYPDGVWFVDLAPLANSALVAQAVVLALELREVPGRPLPDVLVDYLRPKHLLLVLDNCEHLVEECARIADRLLKECPHLRILTTSRQPLGIPGEVAWRVPSLALPSEPFLPNTAEESQTRERDPEWKTPVSEWMEYSAIRLFVERARQNQPSFHSTPHNMQAIVQICRRLDGIPLALELAAARMNAFSPEQIALRLHDRFRLLIGGDRTLPRQQTLQATMDWSYRLLTEEEQALLRRLTVFAGGWTLEAAEAICVGEGRDAFALIELLSALVKKSMVVYEEHQGTVRYRLLETVRQYAGDLIAPVERAEVSRRHAEYFLWFAEETKQSLDEQYPIGGWQKQVRGDRGNLCAALAWWRTVDAERALRLELALTMLGELSYHSQEMQSWIARLQRQDLPKPSPLRAEVYRQVGQWASWLGNHLAARQLWEKSLAIASACHDRRGVAESQFTLAGDDLDRTDYARAQQRLETSLALYQELGDPHKIAKARNRLGHLAALQGDLQTARRLMEESRNVGRQMGDQRIILASLHSLAYSAYVQSDHAAARTYWEECLTILRNIEDSDQATTLCYLGEVSAYLEDFGSAWRYLEEALTLCQEPSHQPRRAWTLFRMALVAARQTDHSSARNYLARSLALFEEIGEKANVALCLDRYALLDREQMCNERAVCLWGYLQKLIQQQQWSVPSRERSEMDARIAEIQTGMDAASFTAAWEKGRVMAQEEAIAYALSANN